MSRRWSWADDSLNTWSKAQFILSNLRLGHKRKSYAGCHYTRLTTENNMIFQQASQAKHVLESKCDWEKHTTRIQHDCKRSVLYWAYYMFWTCNAAARVSDDRWQSVEFVFSQLKAWREKIDTEDTVAHMKSQLFLWLAPAEEDSRIDNVFDFVAGHAMAATNRR